MDWTTVDSLSTREIAEVSAERLRREGFDVQVIGDEAGGMAPHVTLGSTGVEVQVPADQAERAAALLARLDDEA